MKESFSIRHKILKELFKRAESEPNPQYPKVRVSGIDIAESTKIPIDKINIYHELLHEGEEIDCEFCEHHPIHEMFITSKGRQSYIDKKYLKEGRKQFWDTIYDPLKIILPIISTCIAVYAIYQNSNSSSKIDKIEPQLKNLKYELDKIKEEKRWKEVTDSIENTLKKTKDSTKINPQQLPKK